MEIILVSTKTVPHAPLIQETISPPVETADTKLILTLVASD